ncbi:MAG: hypothetical protein WC851_03620 [Candidatus Shapirobacteria bacterium]
MKFSQGLASIPLIIGLVLMAVALPFAGKLALNNQDIRNRAAGNHPSNCSCQAGKYVSSGGSCVVSGLACSTGPSAGCPKGCPAGLICKDNNGGCAKPEEVACRLRGCANKTDVCTSNGCVANPVGKSCTSSSQCSGLVCTSGKCVAPQPTVIKKANGSSCNLDGDCASTHCIGNFPNRKCAYSENNRLAGEGCLVNSVCASGKCSFGKCTAPPKSKLGSACNFDSTCESGYCVSGKCTSSTPLATCISDNDCTGGKKCRGKITDPKGRSCR